MAQILLGKEVNASLNERIRTKAEALKEKGIFPTLGIIRVGEKGDDIAYEKGAMKRCSTLGVEVKQFLLPENVTQEKLMETIRQVNEDETVHGVLMFRPLPAHLDEEAACAALDPEKDVDGITTGSMVGVFTGHEKGFPPCTPEACMEILDYYGFDCRGKRAVVVGRSLVVGKPAAMMLLQKNATVTVCHTKTVDMAAVCREADILIVAAGRPDMIGKDYLSPGQVVIDVGINVDAEGKLCGDVNFGEAESIVAAITPVPGGVGTVTTSVLVGHVVSAAARRAER